MMKFFYVSVLFLFSITHSHAQYLEIMGIDTNMYPRMSAEYLYFDKYGDIIKENTVELYENTIFKKIQKYIPPKQGADEPLSILIVPDMSCRRDGIDGTMVKHTVQQWLQFMKPDDEIGVAVHEGRNTIIADFTDNASLLQERVESIETKAHEIPLENAAIDTMLYVRNIIKRAKHKTIVIFLSHSFTPRSSAYSIMPNNPSVRFYTINMEKTTPDYIRQISEESGGRNFNRTESNTDLLFSRILYEARGGKGGIMEWEGSIYCEGGKKKVELYDVNENILREYSFYPSLRSINEIRFSNEAIRFGGVEPGKEAKKEISIISTRRNIFIKNIGSRNPQYRIEPASVYMAKNTPVLLTLYYKSEDSNYTWTRFSAESNECSFTFDASVGYPAKLPKKNELRIVYPTAQDTIYYGEDFDIVWDGIADFEEVELYGDENLITKNAKGKYRYVWQESLYLRDSIPKQFSIRFCEKIEVPFLENEKEYKYVLSPNRKYLANISFDSVKVFDIEKRKEILSFGTKQTRYADNLFYSTVKFDPHSRYLGVLTQMFGDAEQIDNSVLEVWDIHRQFKKVKSQYFSIQTLSTQYVFWDNTSENIHIPPIYLNHKWRNTLNVRTNEKFFSPHNELLKDVVTYSYSPNGQYIALLRSVIPKVEVYDTETHSLVCTFSYDRSRGDEMTKFDTPCWSYDSEKVLLGAQVTKDTTQYQLLMGNVKTKKVDTVHFEARGFVVGISDCNPLNNYCTLFTTRNNGKETEDTLRVIDFNSGKTIKKVTGMKFGLWLEDGNSITDGKCIYNLKTDEKSFLKAGSLYRGDNYIVAKIGNLTLRNPLRAEGTISQSVNSQTLHTSFVKNVSKKAVRLRYLYSTWPFSSGRLFSDSVFQYEFSDVEMTVEPDDSIDMRAYWYTEKSRSSLLPPSPLASKFLLNNTLRTMYVYPYQLNDSNNKTIMLTSIKNYYKDSTIHFVNNTNDTIMIEYYSLIDNEHKSFSIIENLTKRKITPHSSLEIKIRYRAGTEDTVTSKLVLHYKTGAWYRDNDVGVYNLKGYTNKVNTIIDEKQFVERAKSTILPNPSSGMIKFTFFNDTVENADISVYDILGNKVLPLFSGILDQGKNDFEILDLQTGNYFVVVSTKGKRCAYPFIIIR